MWAYARPVEEINSDVVAADRVGTAAQDAASVHAEQCPNFLSNSWFFAGFFRPEPFDAREDGARPAAPRPTTDTAQTCLSPSCSWSCRASPPFCS